jgi:hypothetical protein
MKQCSWRAFGVEGYASRAMAGLALAALLAACGGSPASPDGVVTLDSPGASGSPDASGTPSIGGNRDQQLLAFSQCMRQHDVPDFPDPVTNGSGGVSLPINGSNLNLHSAAFQAAQQTCLSLLPEGYNGGGNGEGADRVFQKRLAYSQCMRDNGVPNFPDPQRDASGGITGNGGIGKDNLGLDPNSPAFQAAQQTCQLKLPGAAPGISIGGSRSDSGGGSGSSAAPGATSLP